MWWEVVQHGANGIPVEISESAGRHSDGTTKVRTFGMDHALLDAACIAGGERLGMRLRPLTIFTSAQVWESPFTCLHNGTQRKTWIIS